MPDALYFAQILCPEGVLQKINSKHGLTEQDVRDLAQWPARPRQAFWIGLRDDPRGPRAVAVGEVADGRTVKVVLYPVEGPFEGTLETGHRSCRDMRAGEVHHERHELA